MNSGHPRPQELERALYLVHAGKLDEAESLVQGFLTQNPQHVSGMRVMADIAVRQGRLELAARMLEQCLQSEPDDQALRKNHAAVLIQQHQFEKAAEQIEHLLVRAPGDLNFLNLKANMLVRSGNHTAAIDVFEQMLENHPGLARIHMGYGHSLRSVGRVDEAILAYRKCIELGEGIGKGYWNLANLKTFRFTDADIDRMRTAVLDEGDSAEDRAHIAFALGKALEDRGEFAESFRCYAQGNAIWRMKHRHNQRAHQSTIVRQVKLLDRNFFASRQGYGSGAPDPVFIVGLPRAGSTLLEQILASHSKVEGLGELPDIMTMVRDLSRGAGQVPAAKYPELLATLTADQCRELGEDYLSSTRIRRGGKAFFIDKMPNNYQHIGLIQLILPNARIIDARRHPMANCFSAFKQLFASGQAFTYDLQELGQYYRAYMTLMDHWEHVLPGRVLRVQYEEVVADTENQVRRMLDYCGLDFEEQCLRFYETRRTIRTPSAEQVRQPINTRGLEQWRHFEPYLAPLKAALGPLLER